MNKSKTPASPWIGKPVAVVLKDGSYYVGIMEQIDEHAVTLSDVRTNRTSHRTKGAAGKGKKKRMKRRKPIKVSGFLGALSAFPFGALSGMQKALNAAAALYGKNGNGGAASSSANAGGTAGGDVSSTNSTGDTPGPNASGQGQPGLVGFLNQVMPHMRIGLDLVQSIVPILNIFKI